jgi:DNA-binding Lrp family transcriptional regulator
METGYVLLSLKPGMKKEFMQKIRGVKGVKEARLVIGICDVVLTIQADSIRELERIYFNQIDKIESITNSRLHFVACLRTRK